MDHQCILNGVFLPDDKATVSINNRSFKYGDGCFETMQYFDRKIQLGNYHFKRLFAALKTLHFEVPAYFTESFLTNQIMQLVDRNNQLSKARIRLNIYAGNLNDTREINWLLQCWPISTTVKGHVQECILGLYQLGFKAADGLANIKSNNYLLYSQAAWYAKQNNWHEALLLNHYGRIADSSIANLFMVKKNQIFTPLLSEGPVAGIMRQYLLETLPTKGFSVIEAPLMPDALHTADEIFLTNAMGIRSVTNFNQQLYGNGLATQVKQVLGNAGVLVE